MGLTRVLILGVVCGLLVACDRATATDRPEAAPSAEPQPQLQAPSALEEFQRNSIALIANYVRANDVRKVQLGAGSSRLTGWLNTDIEPGGDGLAYLDATKRFPFDDGSIHYIFSEHVIEHLTYEEGKAMIAEAFRVLAPGGKMRISTPDLMQFIALFDDNLSGEARDYLDGKVRWHEWPKEPNAAAIILNLQMSSWGHKFMYDFPTLSGALARAGFINPQEFEENISNDPHLRDLEERDSGVTVRWSNYETMSLEVEKPRETTR
jgi:predicted SAM-dependent methyltransferase